VFSLRKYTPKFSEGVMFSLTGVSTEGVAIMGFLFKLIPFASKMQMGWG
jgi:hypothetical protein